MALTEVKLNNVYYKTKRLPTQVLANQMASKVGQGTSEYGDLTTWSAWIQQDWQEGMGKVKPHLNGGFLYGEVESRVPGQLILPQLVKQVDRRDTDGSQSDCRYIPDEIAGFFEIGDPPTAGTFNEIAVRITTPASFTGLPYYLYLWFYGDFKDSATLCRGGTGATPATDTSGTTEGIYAQAVNIPGMSWKGALFRISLLSTATNPWLTIRFPASGNDSRIAYGDTGYATNTYARQTTNGGVSGSWVAQTGKYAIFSTMFHLISPSTTKGTGAGFFRFNNVLYHYCNNAVFEYDVANDQWDSVGTITDHNSTTGATVFDSLTYFGNGGITTTDYTTMSTSEVFSSTAVNGYLFAKHNGLLWRAYLNEVEYSEDGTTWEPSTTFGDPIYVSDTSEPVTGMCGMGEYMYASTKAGLVVILPGDFAKGVIPWGSADSNNGTSMVNHEGALYIVVNGRVSRFTEDGSLQDIWVSQENLGTSGRLGQVRHLSRMNNWLIAIVEGVLQEPVPNQDSEYYNTQSTTVWAYQNNSWHFLASLPNSADYGNVLATVTIPSGNTDVGVNYSTFYDRTTQQLWMCTPSRLTYRLYVPDYTSNPFNDPLSKYTYSSWIEWDWFDGSVQEAPKDYDSVTLISEGMSSTSYVEVYWKDDDSSPSVNDWQLLGTATSDNQELRWSITGGTRPDTKRFKLGLLFVTLNTSTTPRIRAVRVKYHLMVRDWFRWNVIIDVSGRSGALQMLADGTRHTLTAEQIKDNIDALARQTPPFLYQDVDGTQYEVKITDANFTYDKYEYNEKTTNTWWEGTYNLQLEQVTNAAYA